jgi:hypothetical protein
MKLSDSRTISARWLNGKAETWDQLIAYPPVPYGDARQLVRSVFPMGHPMVSGGWCPARVRAAVVHTGHAAKSRGQMLRPSAAHQSLLKK